MRTGTVKVWFEEKGFGFIAPQEGGEDVFCHRKSLDDGQALVTGATVQFTAEWDGARNKMAVTHCRGAVPLPGGASPAPAVANSTPGAPPPGGQSVTGEMQGVVKVWFEEKGYGFVAPLGGGNDVFVHRNSLADGQALQLNATVTYSAEWDAKRGKYAATRCSGAVPRPDGIGSLAKIDAGAGAVDLRFTPYGVAAASSGLGDAALQQASLQAQQALQMGGGFGQPQTGFSMI